MGGEGRGVQQLRPYTRCCPGPVPPREYFVLVALTCETRCMLRTTSFIPTAWGLVHVRLLQRDIAQALTHTHTHTYPSNYGFPRGYTTHILQQRLQGCQDSKSEPTAEVDAFSTSGMKGPDGRIPPSFLQAWFRDFWLLQGFRLTKSDSEVYVCNVVGSIQVVCVYGIIRRGACNS